MIGSDLAIVGAPEQVRGTPQARWVWRGFRCLRRRRHPPQRFGPQALQTARSNGSRRRATTIRRHHRASRRSRARARRRLRAPRHRHRLLRRRRHPTESEGRPRRLIGRPSEGFALSSLTRARCATRTRLGTGFTVASFCLMVEPRSVHRKNAQHVAHAVAAAGGAPRLPPPVSPAQGGGCGPVEALVGRSGCHRRLGAGGGPSDTDGFRRNPKVWDFEIGIADNK